ncbi:MFS transporter [Parahaliea aestuarii]|uniref:MFS transporter n=1 Tax=Parahaliea aestuarii TaxID=1852021 RepID=A0A5C9A0W9_9GAMM|nr:MFS transporter [Parahaliea aestuarii]TXS93532.1 MFS transporter [Parahaliea aestuarii]
MRTLMTVTSLLISTALLLIGHGIQITLLPLRGSIIGFSEFQVGMSASAYFLGFVGGALVIPRIIAKVGHIRSFAVLTAIFITALLGLEMLDSWGAWLVLRFITGAMICGLYTVIESWLNNQATPESRGQVLAIYTFIVLMSMAAGQGLINVGPVSEATPFMLAAVFLALAIVPVGLTSRLAPAPLESTRIRFSLLYQRSPSAFAGAILSGLVVGGFWSLGAVFAQRYSASLSDVTLFITVTIAGGALFQYPIGWLSDRVDRRRVMLSLCLFGALTAAAVAATVGTPWHLGAVFLFGACTMPMYAISLAMAADNSSSSEFVEIGTSVLMLNALCAAAAPLLLGQLMTALSPVALFWASSALCALFALYVGYQCTRRRQITVEEQTPFSAAGMEAAPTAFDLDPRGLEDEVGDLVPEEAEPAIYSSDDDEEQAASQSTAPIRLGPEDREF